MARLKCGDELRLADGVGRVLFTVEQIRARVAELGAEMAREYAGRVPILVAMLRGGFIMQCDLARALGIPLEIDFLSISRFAAAEKGPTAVKILHDLRSDIRGRHVVVVEGIRTASTKMEYVATFLDLHQPASVSFAALVAQTGARNHRVPLQYKGFDIGDEFVIGCGLDYRERYRNLPVLAEFRPAETA